MRSTPALMLLAATISLSACASSPPAGDQAAGDQSASDQFNDPLEGTNRFIYRVNDKVDTYVVRPVAVAYRDYVPGAVRRPIRNVLNNLGSPIIFSNDVLQGKPRRAGDTMMRFLINSTAGVGGLFDVASGVGYPRHSTDLGVTLALWSVGSGPYLFLPLLGPSNVRDSAGYAGDLLFDPLTWASFGGNTAVETTQFAVGAVDTRERLIDPIDDVKRTALDPYATFRSVYGQNRQSTIEETRNDNQATVPAWFNH